MALPRTSVALALVAAALIHQPALAQAPARDTSADRADVTRVGLDYLDAFYEGDSTKWVRSVRPEFVKTGFSWSRDRAVYTGEQMSWAEALGFIRRVKESGRHPPATAPKSVELLDVGDQIAALKVTAWWGFDYLLAARYEGRWMISGILWQSPPPARGARD
jgi:hypothetical protein